MKLLSILSALFFINTSQADDQVDLKKVCFFDAVYKDASLAFDIQLGALLLTDPDKLPFMKVYYAVEAENYADSSSNLDFAEKLVEEGNALWVKKTNLDKEGYYILEVAGAEASEAEKVLIIGDYLKKSTTSLDQLKLRYAPKVIYGYVSALDIRRNKFSACFSK
jgi:hypothetical protein